LDRLYIAADGARLRVEDRRKAVEVAAILVEIERAAGRLSRRSTIVLVDAAAGKSYVGLLAAKLIFEPMQRPVEIVTIESDPRRVDLSRKAATLLETKVPIECRLAGVEHQKAWHDCPGIVAALHACGSAADAIIDNAIRCEAKTLLLVPCCTSRAVASADRAMKKAERLGFPPQAPVRRRFIQSWVDAERTLRLEAAGYQTEVVELVGATVTPHNLLWRSRRVCEPVRMAAARRRHQALIES
jgi:hypothetical protein